MNKQNTINILLFPGKGLFPKHYQSYFPKATLSLSYIPNTTTIILCHSKGIHEAILVNHNLPIIALDPSTFYDHPNITYFTHQERTHEIPPHILKNQTQIYKPKTHYPYQHKHIRNQIWNTILKKK
jgi:hypothetical protein